MTPDEYLAWEREQTERHEYFDGEVFAMSGVTRNHCKIGSNLIGALHSRLNENPCEVHGSEMRAHVEVTNFFAYPDVLINCPPIEGQANDLISNPTLIAEVLSPSTADYDRGGKFGHYRMLPSLKEYIVVWQNEARVEQHQRTEENLWLLREIVGIDQTLNLASINESIPLSQIFAKVEFAPLNSHREA